MCMKIIRKTFAVLNVRKMNYKNKDLLKIFFYHHQ